MGVTARGLVARRGDFILNIPAFTSGRDGTAVLGPNGAGKTSLLLALQGLIRAEGDVKRPPRQAAVFARPAVLRGSTLWNVSVVIRSVLDTDRLESDVRALRALHDVGLADVADADSRTLSTGQKQRLALARAIACEPHALFLDEPFANIDADARPALRALVSAYCSQSGCSVVLATSTLADAALCASAVVLREGAIVHSGAVRELPMAEDAYVRALVAEARGGVHPPSY